MIRPAPRLNIFWLQRSQATEFSTLCIIHKWTIWIVWGFMHVEQCRNKGGEIRMYCSSFSELKCRFEILQTPEIQKYLWVSNETILKLWFGSKVTVLFHFPSVCKVDTWFAGVIFRHDYNMFNLVVNFLLLQWLNKDGGALPNMDCVPLKQCVHTVL